MPLISYQHVSQSWLPIGSLLKIGVQRIGPMKVLVNTPGIFFLKNLIFDGGGQTSGHEEPGQPAILGWGSFTEALGKGISIGFVVVLEADEGLIRLEQFLFRHLGLP